MNDIQSDIQYDAKIIRSSSFEVIVTPHLIATLVAKQLGLPMPASELTCSVRAPENPPGGPVSVYFEDARGTGVMPLKVTIAPTKDAEAGEAPQ